MIEPLKELYNSIEETYLGIENSILDYAEDAYTLGRDYIEGVGVEIAKYLSNFFAEDSIKQKDPVKEQVEKLKISLISLESDDDAKWDSTLIFIATSIGHMNEMIVEILCDYYEQNSRGSSSQSYKINALKSYLPKAVISDLYFISTFRNSILHYGDYGYNLSNLDQPTKNKLFNDSKAAIAKMEYIYAKLHNIKLSEAQQ